MSNDADDDGPVISPEFRRISGQQVSLAGDLAVVADYRDSIGADEWAGMWFDNDCDPVVIVVAVTRRVEYHRAELGARMASPAQLDVVRHERSECALRALHGEIVRLRGEYPISAVGTDVVANVVWVGLSVHDARHRDELQSRFGTQIRVEPGVWSATAL